MLWCEVRRSYYNDDTCCIHWTGGEVGGLRVLILANAKLPLANSLLQGRKETKQAEAPPWLLQLLHDHWLEQVRREGMCRRNRHVRSCLCFLYYLCIDLLTINSRQRFWHVQNTGSMRGKQTRHIFWLFSFIDRASFLQKVYLSRKCIPTNPQLDPAMAPLANSIGSSLALLSWHELFKMHVRLHTGRVWIQNHWIIDMEWNWDELE